MKTDIHLLLNNTFVLIKSAKHKLFTNDHIIILWNIVYQVIEPFPLPHVLN